MATFDPQFKTQDDRYWNWFKPAEQPLADKSKGLAFETLGKGIEGAAKLADTTVKNVLDNELETELTQKKDNFINQLDQYEAQHGTPRSATNPLNANAEASDQDLMPTKAAAPPLVEKGLQTVASIQNAREQSGKARTTGLDADLLRTIKDLRAKNPGYTDYIDQKASQIVGYNVANKLISDKIAEINEQKSNAQRQAENMEKMIFTSGYPGWEKALTQFKQTGNIAAAQHWYGEQTFASEDVKRKLQNFSLNRAQDADTESKAKIALSAAIRRTATADYMGDNTLNDSAAKSGDTSSYQIEQRLHQIAQNPSQANAGAADELLIQYRNRYAQQVSSLDMLMKNFVTADGKNAHDILGADVYHKMIEDEVGALYKAQTKLYTDGDYGLLGVTKRNVGYIGNTAALNVLRDGGSVGAWARTAMAANQIAPNIFTPELFAHMVGTGQDMAEPMLRLNSIQMFQGVTQTGGLYRAPDGTMHYSFNQSQRELDQANRAYGPFSPAVEAKAYKNLIGLNQAILDKNPKVQDNAMTFFYSPDNMGSLNKFMDDYYDPSSNTVKRGRTSAFETLTSQPITKAVKKRDNEGNKGVWDNYKSWSLGEATANLRKIASTWNQAVEDKSNPLSREDQFYWDNERHRLGIKDANGTVIPEDSWRLNVGLFAMRNANKYFEALARIAAEEGTNPDEMIFYALDKAGLDPKIKAAIAQSYTKPAPEPKEKKE